MAEEEKKAAAALEAAAPETAVAEAEAKPEEKKESEFGGDDMMDLFGDESEVTDDTLSNLVAGLEDIDISDLMEQVRDIQQIMDERRG
jgi:hypothetical protein